jgi:hypothetical protein
MHELCSSGGVWSGFCNVMLRPHLPTPPQHCRGEIRCGRAAHRRNRATKRILEESVQLAGSRTEAIRCSRRAVSALVS